jgi:hypothetical protein
MFGPKANKQINWCAVLRAYYFKMAASLVCCKKLRSIAKKLKNWLNETLIYKDSDDI